MNLLRCRSCGDELVPPWSGYLCRGCADRGDRPAMSWPEFLTVHPEWRDRARKRMGWFLGQGA